MLIRFRGTALSSRFVLDPINPPRVGEENPLLTTGGATGGNPYATPFEPFVPGTRPGLTTGPPGPSPPPVSQGPCPTVDCNFDRSFFCQYQTGGVSGLQPPPDASIRAWRISDRQVANTLTGIFTDVSKRKRVKMCVCVQYTVCSRVRSTLEGMYAYAGLTDEKSDLFVMSSRSFTINQRAKLDFYYYLAGVEGRFRVCVDNLTKCPFEALGKDIKVDSRQWRSVTLELNPGTQTVC